MKKTKEKQITSYSRLVGICETFGARYNPGKEAIKPAALSSLLDQAQQSVEAVTVAQQAYTSAVSFRNEGYAGISKLATRIFHAMASWDASEKTLEDAMRIRRCLAYHPSENAENAKAEDGAQKERKGNPAVHLNFEALASNFKKFVECVKTVPEYAPNEEDLTIEGLEAFHGRLMLLTGEVMRKEALLTQARFKRNELLFGPKGIYGIAKTVKHYMRTAFRKNSDEFRAVSRIRFSKK